MLRYFYLMARRGWMQAVGIYGNATNPKSQNGISKYSKIFLKPYFRNIFIISDIFLYDGETRLDAGVENLWQCIQTKISIQ